MIIYLINYKIFFVYAIFYLLLINFLPHILFVILTICVFREMLQNLAYFYKKICYFSKIYVFTIFS